jgi:hypothetical protein
LFEEGDNVAHLGAIFVAQLRLHSILGGNIFIYIYIKAKWLEKERTKGKSQWTREEKRVINCTLQRLYLTHLYCLLADSCGAGLSLSVDQLTKVVRKA